MTVISVVLGRTFHYVDDLLPFRFASLVILVYENLEFHKIILPSHEYLSTLNNQTDMFLELSQFVAQI